LGELARVLRPGRTLALLNIPLWSIRHFLYLETILNFQTWLVWDALSFPVRLSHFLGVVRTCYIYSFDG
ncbi:MAG: hypothetical protein MUO88_16800, partial [Desulfobacterales bacterium]|nr:hypothetical protein [Desulfobacterales bacterium]